jgi:hypothetical protein
MKWSEFKKLIDAQVHDEAEITFILMDVDYNKLCIHVSNYGEKFSVEG